jgi:GNAT superfamily N-acetyltransferase
MLYIRPISISDKQACLALDPSFVTDHVWQLEQKVSQGTLMASFREVHLPRFLKLAPPQSIEAAFGQTRMGDHFLGAEDSGELRGYIYLRAEAEQGLGWIDHLVVAAPFRRQGIGTALMEEALARAKAGALRTLMLTLQSRNHPGIRFAQKCKFLFSGYSDHYFPKDVALFFARDLD